MEGVNVSGNNMGGMNVTGNRLGISYTCTTLWYRPAFKAT